VEERYAAELQSLETTVTSLAAVGGASQATMVQRAATEALAFLKEGGVCSIRGFFEDMDGNGDGVIEREEWHSSAVAPGALELHLGTSVRELGVVVDRLRGGLEGVMAQGLDMQIHAAGKQVIMAYNAVADCVSGCIVEWSRRARCQRGAQHILQVALQG